MRNVKENGITLRDEPQIVQTIIDLLIEIDGDSESMQYILEQSGQDYQMLRQLMLTMPIEQVEYFLEDLETLKSSYLGLYKIIKLKTKNK
jgi:hypothetical protein